MAQDTPDHQARRSAFYARYREEVAYIDADPDPERAHVAAVDFGKTLERIFREHAVVRARQAIRMRDGLGLSFAALGARIGVSKTRAAQLEELAATDGGPQREDAHG
jgi:hypothetical protein